ncbi:copy number control protein [Philodulcilactobacillus myokoensis]|uniref:Copy number control protein n=1 Tax=Philodulcilactobacillus myokoensis TaxID=2929573 RepID=A0A9W6B446_9LACO|nr:ParA family protein [Philodulcilactobacillus myokoensis]GLB47625.1 copy number control protein [Philodulcilactobacillus myokoensis]
MTTTITFGNFKGGVGKTTNATLIAYTLSRMGHRTLIADLDPQGNATNMLLKTKANIDGKIATFDQSLMRSVEDNNLSKSLISIDPHLDLLASAPDFAMYPRFMEKIHDYTERVKYLQQMFDPFRNNYDYIILDTPPTVMSLFTDSALYMSDYCLIVMQTHKDSFDGARAFIDYLQDYVIDKYKAPRLDLVGILPVLMQGRAPVDKLTLENAIKKFGKENLFKNTIHYMQRIKRFPITGITDKTMYDKRVLHLYKLVTNEMLRRIKEIETNE